MSKIWDGKGDSEGFVYFTKDNGEIVGRSYVRTRIAQHLSRWSGIVPLPVRHAALVEIDTDAWLACRNQQTVSSLCRDAVTVMLEK